MDDNQPPLPWTKGPEISGPTRHVLTSHPHGVLLIVTNGPEPVRIIAHVDATIEFSVIKTSVAQRLGTIIRPVPQQRSIMVPRVGLVTPEEWVAIQCDIPELGIIGQSINVQIAHWYNPLVHMYIGRRFLDQLFVPGLQQTSCESPSRARSDVVFPLAAQRLIPQLHVSGVAVADSPGSATAEHGNNSPPVGFVNGSSFRPSHHLQIPNPHLLSSFTQSSFDNSSGWAQISAPSNVFSFDTFPASSVSSYQANCIQENNTGAQAQTADDVMDLSFDGQSFDTHCEDDMFHFGSLAGDEAFEALGDEWQF